MRTEFGFERTFSTSQMDIECCKIMPSYLVLADIYRIADELNIDIITLADKFLLASAGAIVILHGQLTRIPTIVPSRNSEGHCIFLSNDRCLIHNVAPFGCAFFDYGMPKQEADTRSLAGIMNVGRSMMSDEMDDYAMIWYYLHSVNKIAPLPEDCRVKLEATNGSK